MGNKPRNDASGWQDDELCPASLPDKRLARRLGRLLEQMSAAPGQPVPAACGDWAATKAAYRFFDNPRVTEHDVLAGHLAATAARCAASEGPILLLQDTTEFIYSRAQPGKIGFTKTVNGGRYKAGQPNVVTLCGVLMHASLAITPVGPASPLAGQHRKRQRCGDPLTLTAKAILAEVDEAVATWQEEGRALGLAGHDLDSFADAFEHQERRALRRIL